MREQFHNLQALRGLACLLVIAYHLSQSEAGYGLGFNPLKPFRWFGYAGVDLFFVLSGFIIAASSRHDLGRPSRLPRYLFRRAWRIYPTFWAALAASIAIFAGLSGNSGTVPGWEMEMVETVLLLPQFPVPRLVPAAWTLSYELMFYAAFATLFVIPRRAALPVLFGWAAAVIAAHVTGTHPGNRFAFLTLSPFVLEFLAGALVARSAVALSGRAAGALIGLGMLWSATGLFLWPDPGSSGLENSHFARAVTFGVTAALTVFAATAWERGGGRFRPRWLESVGDASYSVYLLHIPCMMAMTWLAFKLEWSHRKAAHVGWLLLMLTGTILPGLLFYRLVERPLLNLAKKRLPTLPVGRIKPVPSAIPIRRAA